MVRYRPRRGRYRRCAGDDRYAAVISLGAIVAESTTEASAFGIETTSSIAPVLVPAIVLGGVMYPLVFATAGAAIGAVVNAQ